MTVVIQTIMLMLYRMNFLFLCRPIFCPLYAMENRHGTVMSQNFRSMQVIRDVLKIV